MSLLSIQLAAIHLFQVNTSQLSMSLPTAAAESAVNALAVDLLHQVCKPDANAVISPYSIQSAFAMAYAGSEGVTRQEMARVLHYPQDEAALLKSFAQLRRTLEQAVTNSAAYAKRASLYGVTNDALIVAVANRLFGQTGYDFRQPYLDLLKDTCDAPFEELDFKKEPARAANHINGWVETQTRERIRDLSLQPPSMP